MKTLFTLLLSLVIVGMAAAQLRDYRIHKRGMLHQTIYNTGEIGRAYDQGNGGIAQGVPSMEWPGNSTLLLDGVRYRGQHNSFGGGLHLATDATDTTGRLYAYCGGAGSSSPEVVVGKYSFPLSLIYRENLPLLPDGNPNPAFDQNEAEEIIVSRWATATGLTVTRTSRAWSYPDYDDFILYEYEIENTGDRDGKPATIESTAELREVLVGFAYGFTPSMFGYERTFNRWSYADYEANDLRARFDRNRWLEYAIDRDGKPEPRYFAEWAANNTYGGGLLSPQAVGFLPLYYDTTHLARQGETVMPIRTSDTANIWMGSGRVKQPYLNRLETSNMRIGKIGLYYDITMNRKNNPYTNLAVFGPDWVGRGSFNVRQSKKFGVGRILVFGPYIIPYGEKIRFAIAEVAGYGAARVEQTQAGMVDEGGSCGEYCGEPSDAPFFPVPNWTEPITYGLDNTTYGSNYLSLYQYPQYVNSNVVTVREVADRAIQLYTGRPFVSYDTLQYWPHDAPDRGVYTLPIPPPAPVLDIISTDLAENLVSWNTAAEEFSVANLTAPFSHYEICKSNHPLGPWARLDSIPPADPRYFSGGIYSFLDKNTRVGESYYYSVLSVDAQGYRSGRTNVALHQTQIGGTESLEKVVVVPNPFIVRSGFTGTTASGADAGDKIGFYNLPRTCTIRVYSYSGQLVQTIEHDSGLYSTEWLQVTRNNQLIASGLYFYVVQTPDGEKTHGKFVVIQ